MEPISFVPLEVDDGTRASEGRLEIEFDGAHDARALKVVCEALRQR